MKLDEKKPLKLLDDSRVLDSFSKAGGGGTAYEADQKREKNFKIIIR